MSEIISIIISMILSLLLPLQGYFPDDVIKPLEDMKGTIFYNDGAVNVEKIKTDNDEYFYQTLNLLYEDLNDTVIDNNCSEEDGNLLLYFNDKNTPVIVVLEDYTENEKIKVEKESELHLNKKTLSIRNTHTGFELKDRNNKYSSLKVFGKNACIEMVNDHAAMFVAYENTRLEIYSGTYITESLGMEVDENWLSPSGRKYETRGIYTSKGDVYVENAYILTFCDNGNSYGIMNYGNIDVKNTYINSDAKYSDDGVNYIYLSVGIQNVGKANIVNCDITGTHSGISSYGELSIDGGTYRSCGHGGIYFCGSDTESYVKNAKIIDEKYMGKYDVLESTYNGAGFYIGGSSTAKNITVYMDNCEMYGEKYPFVLRGSSGEQNIELYISNSSINIDEKAKIRIDNDTHTLYIGENCNFKAEDTTRPLRVIYTNEKY